MERGYVKLWRKIEDSAVFGDAHLLQLFLWLLVRASRKPWRNTNGEAMPPGSVTVTNRDLAEQLKCPKTSILRRLRNLESLGMIRVRTDHQRTTISIMKWLDYQCTACDSADRARTTSGPPILFLDERDEKEQDKQERANGKTKGASSSQGAERSKSPSSRSRRSPQSPKDFLPGKEPEESRGEPLDLSAVDWDHVIAMAEAAAKRVPPRTAEDRRLFLRFAVLAETTFSEAWLVDAAQAVVAAGGSRGTRQGHYVGVLQTKALEQHGIDRETLTALARRIEIPTAVWKSKALRIAK